MGFLKFAKVVCITSCIVNPISIPAVIIWYKDLKETAEEFDNGITNDVILTKIEEAPLDKAEIEKAKVDYLDIKKSLENWGFENWGFQH